MSETATTTPSLVTLPGTARPSKAMSKSDTRPSLEHGHVVQEGERRVLITTDAYILVRHPVGDDVPLGPIHPDALRHIEKGGAHEIDEGSVTARADRSVTTWRVDGISGLFVDKPAPTFNPGDADVVELAIDAELLVRLAKALGSNGTRGVKLAIPVRDGKAEPKAIRVTPLTGIRGEEGLLMPLRFNA